MYVAFMAIINTRSALLQALLSGEGYGRELIDRVRNSTNGKILLLDGCVYPALRELESEGLIRSWESELITDRDGRPRRFYRLTALGGKTATEERSAMIGLLTPSRGTIIAEFTPHRPFTEVSEAVHEQPLALDANVAPRLPDSVS